MPTLFRPQIRSRHATHQILRENTLPLLPFRSVVRLGSTTDLSDTVTNGGRRVELNTIQAIKNSANKYRMKKCFHHKQVQTPIWYTTKDGKTFVEYDEDYIREVNVSNLPNPIVCKQIFGSRGRGNTLINSRQELLNWFKGKDLDNYIFEKFYSYSREYRLHVTKDGCFYTCRKMLKGDTPPNQRWFRNNDNSIWIVENNPEFEKPFNWKDIEDECVLALKAVGLDIGACDVRVQSSTDSEGYHRKYPDFTIVEINSAPSFGAITSQKYIEIIPKVLKDKRG